MYVLLSRTQPGPITTLSYGILETSAFNHSCMRPVDLRRAVSGFGHMQLSFEERGERGEEGVQIADSYLTRETTRNADTDSIFFPNILLLPFSTISVLQRSAKVFFLGCVTRLLRPEASHAT